MHSYESILSVMQFISIYSAYNSRWHLDKGIQFEIHLILLMLNSV